MKVKMIPCLKDNYAYLIESTRGELPANILVDAPDFQTVDRFLIQNNLKLDHLLITHHHWDHTDGILELKEKYNCTVYGYKDDENRIPGIDVTLRDKQHFTLGDISIHVMHVPGHTNQHILYHFENYKILFTGDTLFSMGCGRLFEGTYAEMFNSLQKIKGLSPDTLIFCGHEYSVKNAEFALSVNPENQDLQKRYRDVLKLREKNQPTVPTSLALELQINPFLRASTVDEFSKLRQLRDTF